MASKVYQFVYYLMHMKIKRKKGEWGQCEGEQGLTNESWLTISWITINNITEAFQWGEIAQIHSAQMRLGWEVSGPTTSAWMDWEAFVHGREKRAILLLSHIEICENRRRGGSFFADFYRVSHSTLCNYTVLCVFFHFHAWLPVLSYLKDIILIIINL